MVTMNWTEKMGSKVDHWTKKINVFATPDGKEWVNVKYFRNGEKEYEGTFPGTVEPKWSSRHGQ